MSLTLQTAVRNASCDAECAFANGGHLVLRAGSTTLATIALAATAFEAAGTSAPGVARLKGGNGTTFISVGNPVAFTGVAAGDADNYQIRTSADALAWAGTISGTAGTGDMKLDNVTVAISQLGSLTAFSHTVPDT